MFQVRSIRITSGVDEGRLLEAHRLARVVFEPDVSEDEYESVPPRHRNMDLELWREKVSMKHGELFYVTRSIPPTSTEPDAQDPHDPRFPVPHELELELEPETNPILGIFLTHPRYKDNLQSYHIFISAVHPSTQGQGIFSILLNATKKYARKTGYEILTVTTVPGRFERMWRVLSKEGSGWVVVRWEGEGEGRKVVMKMGL